MVMLRMIAGASYMARVIYRRRASDILARECACGFLGETTPFIT